MKSQEIQKHIDRIVGTEGTLRIPSWWMHKILSDLVKYCEEIESTGETIDISAVEKYVQEQLKVLKEDISNGFVAKEEGKGLSSNDYTDTDKEKLDGLQNYDDSELRDEIAKRNVAAVEADGSVDEPFNPITALYKKGVVTQDLTREGSSSVGYKNVVSNPQYGAIPQSFIDQVYEDFGVSFNADTGYFEYDDITNLSYEEALESATVLPTYQRFSLGNGNTLSWYFNLKKAPNYAYSKLRVILVPRGLREGGQPRSYWVMRFDGGAPIHLESANLFATYPATQTWANFYYCLGLRKAGKYSFSGLSSVEDAFNSCYSLEEVWIKSLGCNVNFSGSSLLKNECILYMIQNEKATKAITITLHPTAHARAMADEAIVAALEAHPNITLASA